MSKKETIKKILPRGKYILVRQDEPESRENEFGIIIPTSTEVEQKAQGDVIAVGNGITDIKKGDKVVFGAYAGEKMIVKEGHKQVDYLLLYDDDVIAFIQ